MSARSVFSQEPGAIENNCEEGKSENGADQETFTDTFSAAFENNDGRR
jgi:hypothetical protein